MNDAISSDSGNVKTESITTVLSSDNNEVKYCESNDTNYKFKEAEYRENDEIKQDDMISTDSQKLEDEKLCNGEIEVTSILDCGEHEYLQGVKINLYKINGLSPILIKSRTTNEEGKVIFSDIEEGCYRIIEIVDKRYFEKPKYINWNEIIIDNVNKKQKIVVVNKIKKFISQNKHKCLV